MKKIFQTIVFLSILFSMDSLYGQEIPTAPNQTDANNKKQGKWVILYDKNWKVIQEKEKIAFYRTIIYLDDKPRGKVTDWYKNGQAQMIADSLIQEAPAKYEGNLTFFREDGTKEKVQMYKGGNLFDEIHFDKEGNINEESWVSLMKKGVSFYNQGNYKKASILWEKAKSQIEKEFGKKNSKYTTSCAQLAQTYHYQGMYDKSESLFLEAKGIEEEILGKTASSYITICNNLASLYYEQELYSKAELLFIEAKNLDKNHPDYATSCNNLASLYKRQGLYSKAEPLYIEAKNIREKKLGKTHYLYASSCNSLATLYHEQKLYSKAEPLYIEAKNIREKKLGKTHPNYANSCNNLASLYEKQGLYSKAEPLYIEAKKIWAEKLGKTHYLYAVSCNNLAGLYWKQGLYTKAESFYMEAKNIWIKKFDKTHSYYTLSCDNLAGLYSEQRLFEKAILMYKELHQNIKRQIRNNFPILSEIDRKKNFQNQIKERFEIYNTFCFLSRKDKKIEQKKLGQMYNNRLFTKSLLFNSSQKMKARVLASGDSTLVENYQHYLAKLRQYNKALELPIAARKQKGISVDTLYLEAQELEKQLSRQSTAFAQHLEEYQAHTWQEVQATLQKNEVAIEIIRFNWYNKKWTDTVYYAALIVTPETQDHPAFVVLENGNDLENKYSKNYYQNIDNTKQDGESYTQFWQPIEDKLQAIKAFQGKKNRRIYISLDGAYYQINLHTLQNPQTGKYLEEDYDIQVVSNTKDLLQPASQFSWKAAEKDAVELFGYPLYDTFPDKQEAIDDQDELDYLLSLKASNRGITDSTDRGRTWHILFGTKKEIQAIEEILQPKYKVAQHIRTAANETALKKLFSPPILHIATHGYFLADIPQDTTNRQMAGTSTYDLRKNPLLRSGLILAGANHTWQGNPPEVGENGILTAQEAKELNLDHTQLVVLSACETGKGTIQNGEGIFGLQRAFLSAGSDFVLNSLWKVDDEATQILMTYFYKYLLKYSDIRKALKKAKQDLRKYEGGKFDSPKYWGAFILVGR